MEADFRLIKSDNGEKLSVQVPLEVDYRNEGILNGITIHCGKIFAELYAGVWIRVHNNQLQVLIYDEHYSETGHIKKIILVDNLSEKNITGVEVLNGR